MKVTPKNRRFGKYAPGDEFELPDKTAKLLIRVGKLLAAPQTYQTREMTAQAPEVVRVPDPVAFQKNDPEPEPAAVEFDSRGDVWDENLHVSTRLKNVDGTWRKRPGARASEE